MFSTFSLPLYIENGSASTSTKLSSNFNECSKINEILNDLRSLNKDDALRYLQRTFVEKTEFSSIHNLNNFSENGKIKNTDYKTDNRKLIHPVTINNSCDDVNQIMINKSPSYYVDTDLSKIAKPFLRPPYKIYHLPHETSFYSSSHKPSNHLGKSCIITTSINDNSLASSSFSPFSQDTLNSKPPCRTTKYEFCQVDPRSLDHLQNSKNTCDQDFSIRTRERLNSPNKSDKKSNLIRYGNFSKLKRRIPLDNNEIQQKKSTNSAQNKKLIEIKSEERKESQKKPFQNKILISSIPCQVSFYYFIFLLISNFNSVLLFDFTAINDCCCSLFSGSI